MSLGPVLKVNEKTFKIFNLPIPLPYLIAYYLVPGFKALRAPSRWLLIATFASSGLIIQILSKVKARLFLVTILICCAIVGGSRIQKVFTIVSYNRYPKVYEWMKQQSGDAIIEIPIYTWASGESAINEMYRMIYSLKHQKNLFNGYSGFFPPQWELLVSEINRDFPNKSSEDKLRNLGIDYVLIHKNEFQEDKLIKILNWGEKKVIWEEEEIIVFKL